MNVEELNDIVFSKTFQPPSAWADRERKYKMEKRDWEIDVRAPLETDVEPVPLSTTQAALQGDSQQLMTSTTFWCSCRSCGVRWHA